MQIKRFENHIHKGDFSQHEETLAIYVATHKEEPIELPEGYIVCQVNTERNGKWGGTIAHDNDSSDNISLKNDRYCELTALYELWKNNDADIKGLAHYRRYFKDKSDLSFQEFLINTTTKNQLCNLVLTKRSIIQALKTSDIIVQFPRNPYSVNVYEDLLRFVYPKDIRALSDIIHKYYPDYEQSYKTILQSRHISYLNMLIARNEFFSAYCEWLFSVLFRLENVIEIEDYDAQHKRIYGYLGEVLLNVWIYQNKLRVKYTHFIEVIPQSKSAFLINNSRIARSLYLLYFKLCRKTKYATSLKMFDSLKDAWQEPYTYTLDKDYQKIKSLEDAERYFLALRDGMVCRETITVNDKEYTYICLKKECNMYKYIQSNNICVITVFIDNLADVEAVVPEMYQKYDNRYTVNIRVITNDPQVQLYRESVPEVYIYKIDHDQNKDG